MINKLMVEIEDIYRITDNGKNKLEMYRNEWISYTEKLIHY